MLKSSKNRNASSLHR